MSWEEIVFVTTNLAQIPMMWPMLRDKEKPPLVSSTLLAIRALVCGVAYASSGFALAFIAMLSVTIIWLLLAIQKYRKGRNRL